GGVRGRARVLARARGRPPALRRVVDRPEPVRRRLAVRGARDGTAAAGSGAAPPRPRRRAVHGRGADEPRRDGRRVHRGRALGVPGAALGGERSVSLLFRITVYVAVLFLVAIVVVGQHHVTARGT